MPFTVSRNGFNLGDDWPARWDAWQFTERENVCLAAVMLAGFSRSAAVTQAKIDRAQAVLLAYLATITLMHMQIYVLALLSTGRAPLTAHPLGLAADEPNKKSLSARARTEGGK